MIRDIYSVYYIKKILKEYKIFPSKKLGQNFLVCQNIAKNVVDAALLEKEDLVLEVGPGLGALTQLLIEKGGRVVAVEKDKRLFEFLKSHFGDIKNLNLINDDVLSFLKDFKEKKYKIVASLPYPVTSYFLRQIIEKEEKPDLAVLIVQKEVGQKISATPPEMNLISVICQIFSRPEIVKEVPASCFYPKPKVDSVILKLSDFKNPFGNSKEQKLFLDFLKIGFAQKRKFLISNLQKGLDIGKEKIERAFLNLDLEYKVRAENLSPQQWLLLYKILFS